MNETNFPSTGRSFVKSVISGDTLVLRGKATNGPPTEVIFTLTNIVAPRMSRGSEPEEKNAFKSREFLRTALVGKEVQFHVQNSSSNDRHFGSLSVQHPIYNENDVARMLIRSGAVALKRVDTAKRNYTDEQIYLEDLETLAKDEKLGIWSEEVIERNVNQTFTGDARKFLQNYQNKAIEAVIEQVREGSSFRVLLFLSETEHQFINLNLSGIITPKTEEPAEPFAQECKYFVESRLLQRTVKILIESVNGVNFYGTVLHPAGNISELLLKEGYAKIVDWNINLVKNPDVYKKIQMEAQAKKLRIWKSFIKTDKSQDYLAIVRKIIGPDLIVVESVAQPGIEQKLQLSSVRGPKKQKNEQNHEVGYFTDAIEFLRFRLIGSKVQIKIDYIKPGEGEYEARENATVFKNNKNIAEALVLKGYASVIRHRRDDNNRSSCYDSLLLAEESAKVLEVGIYSTKDLPIHRVVDASVNQAKAKGHLGQLQRSGMIKGVVEYVPSGSRFKVMFPSLSMRISLVLGGIRTPKSGGSAHKGEPFGEEASKYANDMIFQRDVEVSIENCDKTGGFIGSIFVPVSGKMENFAVLLLKQGISTIHEFSAQQSPYKNQLFEAETEAKNAKRNIWSTYNPEAELLAEKLTNAEVVESKIVEIVVCEIKKNSLYVQVMGPALKKLEQLMVEFADFHSGAGQTVTSPFSAAQGSYCSAQFSQDKQWYRARVEKVVGVNNYQVLYIDYGNYENVPGSRLRPLTPQFSVAKLPAQALELGLHHVEFPSDDSEFVEDCFSELSSQLKNAKLAANIVGKKDNIQTAIIYAQTNDKTSRISSVNEKLIREGLAIVPSRMVKKFYEEKRRMMKSGHGVKVGELDHFIDAMEQAKKQRLNLWQYGDFTQDDDL